MRLLNCAIAALLLLGCYNDSGASFGAEDSGNFTESYEPEDSSDEGNSEPEDGTEPGDETEPEEEDCGVVGTQISCPCPNNMPDGVQICLENGSFGECLGCEFPDETDSESTDTEDFTETTTDDFTDTFTEGNTTEEETTSEGINSTETTSESATNTENTSSDETTSTDTDTTTDTPTDTSSDETTSTNSDSGTNNEPYRPCDSEQDCEDPMQSCTKLPGGHSICTKICSGVYSCPETLSGDASPICKLGGMFKQCFLDCSNGEICPTGLECLNVPDLGLTCWGQF